MYTIEIARAAQADLATLRVFDRARILAVIKAELSQTPTVAARHRKVLHDLRPAWDHIPRSGRCALATIEYFMTPTKLAGWSTFAA